MQCPHCRIAFHESFLAGFVALNAQGKALKDSLGYWRTKAQVCPSCQKAIIFLEAFEHKSIVGTGTSVEKVVFQLLVYPKGTARPPVPKVVPEKIGDDYTEACLVLADSSKASAALSRRCLQNLLREAAHVKPGDLVDEIQQVLDSKQLPSHIAEALDAVRNIGNFASHPMKSKQSGQIVEVELGEAEWTLDVLESLFDYYFVQPAILATKKAALNAKLKDVGKPPMRR